MLPSPSAECQHQHHCDGEEAAGGGRGGGGEGAGVRGGGGGGVQLAARQPRHQRVGQPLADQRVQEHRGQHRDVTVQLKWEIFLSIIQNIFST